MNSGSEWISNCRLEEDGGKSKRPPRKVPRPDWNECFKEIDNSKEKARRKKKDGRRETLRKFVRDCVCDAKERHVAGTSLVLSTQCLQTPTLPSSYQSDVCTIFLKMSLFLYHPVSPFLKIRMAWPMMARTHIEALRMLPRWALSRPVNL